VPGVALGRRRAGEFDHAPPGRNLPIVWPAVSPHPRVRLGCARVPLTSVGRRSSIHRLRERRSRLADGRARAGRRCSPAGCCPPDGQRRSRRRGWLDGCCRIRGLGSSHGTHRRVRGLGSGRLRGRRAGRGWNRERRGRRLGRFQRGRRRSRWHRSGKARRTLFAERRVRLRGACTKGPARLFERDLADGRHLRRSEQLRHDSWRQRRIVSADREQLQRTV
jgi:hypothetical protein